MSKTTNKKTKYHHTEGEPRPLSKKVQMEKPPKNHRWIDELDDFDNDFEDYDHEEH